MRFRPALCLLLVPLAACQAFGPDPAAGSEASSVERVEAFSRQGQHAEAVLAAEAYHAEHPDDPEGARQLRRAKAAMMLDQARRLCFDDKDNEALLLVRQALEEEPDERVLQEWERKLLTKLAGVHTAHGDEFFATTDLDAAREQYELALSFVPDFLRAREGLSQVLLQINYRRGMGENYYREGVQLMTDYWLEQSRTRFVYVNKYQPANDRAKMRKGEVDAHLAASRCTLAADLERLGLWAGARNEYRLALIVDPDSVEAAEGLDRTRIEAGVQDKLREADRLIRARKWDQALEVIREARAQTKHQVEKCDGAADGVDASRLEQSYQHALALEADQDFEAAVLAYDRLVESRGYYKDVLTRRETLRAYIAKAGPLYDQAMAATDPAEKLRLLKQITLFWPEYRNVRDVIGMLEAIGSTPAEPSAPAAAGGG